MASNLILVGNLWVCLNYRVVGREDVGCWWVPWIRGGMDLIGGLVAGWESGLRYGKERKKFGVGGTTRKIELGVACE